MWVPLCPFGGLFQNRFLSTKTRSTAYCSVDNNLLAQKVFNFEFISNLQENGYFIIRMAKFWAKLSPFLEKKIRTRETVHSKESGSILRSVLFLRQKPILTGTRICFTWQTIGHKYSLQEITFRPNCGQKLKRKFGHKSWVFKKLEKLYRMIYYWNYYHCVNVYLSKIGLAIEINSKFTKSLSVLRW